MTEIIHYDLQAKAEKATYAEQLLSRNRMVIGITAGASCPNHLNEETILRVFELRGVPRDQVVAS